VHPALDSVTSDTPRASHVNLTILIGVVPCIEPISKDEALAYAKYAGLSPDRYVRAGFEREEDHWLMESHEVNTHRVIGRTI
jgi:hypothetical protein